MANIELDGANKKIKVDSGDLTLDVPGDIVLDADGGDVVVADGGTNILKVSNSSSDVVLQPQVDAKDIIFKQYDGTTVATVEDNATFNIPASKLAIGGTAVTATAAEINLIDGGTARGTTAIADGDGVLINDAGTMRQTTVETLKTYIGGFDVSSITGATALAAQPAADDEIVLSDAGTLKRLDIKHIQNTPAFMARPSGGQAISNTTWTKIDFGTEDLDTDSNFASSRFTPTTAGYYLITLKSALDEMDDQKRIDLQLYKNGSSLVRDATQASMSGGNSFPSAMIVGYILQMNGSSDYVEGYIYQDHGSNRDVRFGSETHFSGFRIAGV